MSSLEKEESFEENLPGRRMSAPAEPPPAWEKIIASYAYNPTGGGESGSCPPPSTPPLAGKAGAGRSISSAHKKPPENSPEAAIFFDLRSLDFGDSDPFPSSSHNQDPGFDKPLLSKKRKRGKSREGAPPTGKRASRRKKIVVISPYFASSAEKLIQREAEKGNSVEVVVWKRPQTKKTGKPEGLEGEEKKKTRDPPQLSAKEKTKDAYKRVTDDNRWCPPFSELDLLQEFHFFDHWRVLVICMLLNRTTGQQVRRILPRLFLMCPDAESAAQTPDKEIEDIIRPLGLQNKRTKMIKRMSEEYLSPDWTHVTQLHGIGKYAADAYAIFCSGKWKDVKPDDHKLVDYWRFLMEDFDARMSITVEQLPSFVQTQ